MTKKYIEKILTARVYDVADETPLDTAKILSKRQDNQVLLKREDLQSVFSFKLRGAYNRIYQLTRSKDVNGVVAASAGNHAQGVALAAREFGVPAVIVMPSDAPAIKIDNTALLALSTAPFASAGFEWKEADDSNIDLLLDGKKVARYVHPTLDDTSKETREFIIFSSNYCSENLGELKIDFETEFRSKFLL